MKSTNVTKRIYGAYGSNLNIQQIAWRCPDAVRLITGYINDYRLTFRRGGYANIEPSAGHRVPVLLWKVSRADEMSLDRYEGFPRFYVKVDIPVETETGTINAMFYVMADQYTAHSEAPTERYYKTLLTGYLDNRLPMKYLNQAIAENRSELNAF